MTLMAFVLLLMLSLGTWINVETRLSTTQASLNQARANALLGVNVALGELQRAAGPDQRVTATSDLVTTQAGQTHWTGVWNTSGRNPLAPYGAPTDATWLVSGRDIAGNPLTPGATIDDEITLVADTRHPGSDTEVQVGRVEIEATDAHLTGGYAYWISDEGVKAKINVTDPHRDAPGGDDEQMRYSLMSAQRYGIETVSATQDSDGSTIGDVIDPLDIATSEQLARLAGLNQLGLVDSDLDAVRANRFHDLTTYSNGLLANTARGGLKKDLSLAFEMDLNDFNDSVDFAADGETVPGISNHKVDYLFKLGRSDFNTPTPMIGSPEARGPTWHLLRNYYRLYKSNDPDQNQSYKLGHPAGVQSSGSGYTIAARPAFPQTQLARDNTLSLPQAYYDTDFDINANDRFKPGNSTADLPRPTDMDITPMLLRMQTFISIQAIEESASTSAGGEPGAGSEGPVKYKIILQFDPVVTIMNPYNVSLTFDEFVVGWKYFDLNIAINLTQDGTNADHVVKLTDLGKAEYFGLTNFGMSLMGTGGSSVTLGPGEIKVFTYDQEDLRTAASYHEDTSHKSILTPYATSADSPSVGDGIKFETLDNNGSAVLYADEGSPITVMISTLGSTFTIPVDLKRNLSTGTDYKHISLGVLNAPTNGNTSFSWPPDTPRLVEEIRNDEGELKHPIGVIDVNLKPVVTGKQVQFLTHYNPRAVSFKRNTGKLADLGEDLPNAGNWFLGVASMGEWGDYGSGSGVAIDSNGSGYWGDSNQATPSTRVSLFEIPTLPLQSLAALQHVNNITHYAQEPAYAIGNSYASPFIPKESVTRTIRVSGKGYTQLDWSYLCNNALWDDYYFSTLSPRLDTSPAEYDMSEIVDHWIKGESLPNSRITFYLKEGESVAGFKNKVIDSSTNSKIAAEAYSTLAGNLMLDGAFNVNSTSVEAWKALLSATHDLDVAYNGGVASSLDFPFSRMSRPAGNETDAWAGFRSLSDAQIEDLAEAIVTEVQARGPFVSLSDFINRRLSDDNSGLKGALQTAIDHTDINGAFTDTVDSSDLSGRSIPYAEHAMGPVASGAPGYLRQSDLLMTLGPVLTARSDTFKIRAYGDSINQLTGQKASAWCEVVVQRVPEFVDPANEPSDSMDALNGTNLNLGRRFKVVSFRWLDSNQI